MFEHEHKTRVKYVVTSLKTAPWKSTAQSQSVSFLQASPSVWTTRQGCVMEKELEEGMQHHTGPYTSSFPAEVKAPFHRKLDKEFLAMLSVTLLFLLKHLCFITDRTLQIDFKSL